MTSAELRQEVDRLGPWHYNHVFPGNISTGDSPIEETHPKLVQLLEAGAFARKAYPKVLDLGANSGLIAMWFVLHKMSQVTAVEGNPRYYQQLRLAIKVKNFEGKIIPVEMDVARAGFGKDLYDLVLCLGLLHHIQPDKQLAVIKGCHKALMPAGEIIIQTDSTLPVVELMTEAGFLGIRKLETHWSDRAAWVGMKDPMKLW